MAHRAEEKERRRQERLAEEQRAASAARTARRLRLVGGAALGVAVIAVAALLVSGSGDDGASSGPAQQASDGAPIPRPGANAEPARLEDAARDAGCRVREVPSEGQGHTTETVEYRSNPPTSGEHDPVPAEDGIYEPGNAPTKEKLTHALEHGRVLIHYRAGLGNRLAPQLETLFNEEVNGTAGYHTVLLENNTGMSPAIAATAWTQMLTCRQASPKVFDALRAFRERYIDKGPEFVP